MEQDVVAEIEEKKTLIREYEDKLKKLRLEVARYNTKSPEDVITSSPTLSLIDDAKDGKASDDSLTIIDKRRSDMPSMAEHTVFAWNDVNVHVGRGNKQKQILHDLSGCIVSGELMAIMGPSGLYAFDVPVYISSKCVV